MPGVLSLCSHPRAVGPQAISRFGTAGTAIGRCFSAALFGLKKGESRNRFEKA